VKLALIIIGLMCAAFIGGFVLAGWVRQSTIDELHREVKQCQDGRARLQELIDTLTQELGTLRRSLGG
jgi:outer membrane murein-binding lipoprotein Lpp